MSNNKLEQEVIKRVTPTKEYRDKVEKIITELKNLLEHEIKNKKLPVKIELVGSIAKDTYLMNNMDIDFFLCFPTSFSKEKIAKNSLLIGKKYLTKTEESYAEHPYIRGLYKDFKVEIVPCYQIEKASQKLSAVDRTPLHTKYIKDKIKESQKKEVRLFKQFLTGINCYGAEAEIEGFSGYLCEILILKYKTFQSLIKNTDKWKKGKKISIKKGNYPDFKTPLVFIDPVDSNRNVASAVSQEKFNLFIKACNEYNKNPKITFFFPNKIKPWSIKKIKKTIQKQDKQFIGIKLKKPEIIDENLYPQIRKAIRSIEESCNRNDFIIIDIKYHVNNNQIYIIIQTNKEPLSETYIHKGPPIKLKENSTEFLNKWKNNKKVITPPFERNKRLYVELKRDYIEIKRFLSEELKNLSMGKSLDPIIKKGYDILSDDHLFIDRLKIFWTQYLDGKETWER